MSTTDELVADLRAVFSGTCDCERSANGLGLSIRSCDCTLEQRAADAIETLTRERDEANKHVSFYAKQLGECKSLCVARWELMNADTARIAKLEEALKDIAKQKKTTELVTSCDVEYADFEEGYDTCIDVAREALEDTP